MPLKDEDYTVQPYMSEGNVVQFAKDWIHNDDSEFQVWPTQMEMRAFMQSVLFYMDQLEDLT